MKIQIINCQRSLSTAMSCIYLTWTWVDVCYVFRISTLSVSTFLLRLLCVFYHEIKVWELRNGDTRWLLLSTQHGRWLCKFVRQKKMPNKKFLSKSSFHLMLIVDWSENRISVKVLGLLILGVTGFDTNFFYALVIVYWSSWTSACLNLIN